MAFGKAMTERPEVAATERKQFVSPFLKLTPEKPEAVIRILDKDIVTFWRYWLKVNLGDRWDGRPVIVGRNSPIKEHFAQFQKGDKRYQSPAMRAYINVLDRTPVDGVPTNQVKIWEVGRELVEALQVFDGRQINRTTMQKMSLQEFDLMLVRVERRDQNGEVRANIVPSPSFNDDPLPEELLKLPRYDLVKMSQPMPDEAQIRLLNGESYNDVRNSLGWLGEYPLVDPSEDSEEIPF